MGLAGEKRERQKGIFFILYQGIYFILWCIYMFLCIFCKITCANNIYIYMLLLTFNLNKISYPCD